MPDIYENIDAGTVTAADFNRLIETSFKSACERTRRVTEPIDHNRMNDSEGHSRVGEPNMAARAAPRKGGGKLNDPRRTARGRSMLRRQKTRNESADSKTDKILAIIRKHTDPVDICGIYWDGTKLTLSVGDWAEFDRGPLKDELEGLLGADNLEIEAEIGQPDGTDRLQLESVTYWMYRCPECGAEALNGDPEKQIRYRGGARCRNGHTFSAVRKEPVKKDVAGFSESAGQEAKRATFKAQKAQYDPVCPHCDQVMYEKHYVPELREGVDPVETTGLWIHRGPCHDKGAFAIEWPKTTYDEAAEFIERNHAREITESAVAGVARPSKLKSLTARLLRESDGLDRDWLYSLHLMLERTDG